MHRREFFGKAALLGLSASTLPSSQLFAAPRKAVKLRGHVVSGEKPIAGVAVSDGYQVVKTNDSGEFSLVVDHHSGPFLFITIPAGYWSNRFYIPSAQAGVTPLVFQLVPQERSDEYSAIYLTDVHLGEGHAEQSYSRLAATIHEINRLEPLPAFCWVGGDLTLQGGKGERYVQLMSQLKIPVRTAVGNHEMLVREPDPRAKFQQLFGPTYYSFDVGRVHYVTLDGCHVNPAGTGYKNVEGRFSERELHWLTEDLRQVSDEMTVVVAIHIPLVSDYPERRGTKADQVPYWVMQDTERVLDLLARHRTALVLQGHLHENQRQWARGIEFVESISVCGRWWKAAEGTREYGVSGEPRGYRVLHVRQNHVQHRYVSSAESRTSAIGEVVGRPDSLPQGKDALLAINFFDASERATVSAGLDDDSPVPLGAANVAPYHENLKPAHHWGWRIAADRLTPGTHALRLHLDEPGQPSQYLEHLVTVRQ